MRGEQRRDEEVRGAECEAGKMRGGKGFEEIGNKSENVSPLQD